ncbi:MAG TPA: LysR substrate-binding domain-containing protein [Baekduia sp.]
MELRHLRYFVAVAEELHFRRAGERLHVAQPAVSEQVRKLEQELGVRLLDRNQRRVSLTPAGAALLDEARHVLRQAEIAQQAARTASDRANLRVRLGYLPDSLPAAAPRALRHLAAVAPRIRVDLEAGPALRLIEAVRSQRLDAAIIGLPAPTAGLRAMPLGHQRAMAVVPAGHRHARDPMIAISRLAPERLVVLPRDANPAFFDAVVAIARNAGLSPTLVETQAPHVAEVLLAVTAGAGLAVLPESATERNSLPGVRFVPIETAVPAFQTAIVTRPHTDKIATLAFLRALAASVRGHAGERSAVPVGAAA